MKSRELYGVWKSTRRDSRDSNPTLGPGMCALGSSWELGASSRIRAWSWVWSWQVTLLQSRVSGSAQQLSLLQGQGHPHTLAMGIKGCRPSTCPPMMTGWH